MKKTILLLILIALLPISSIFSVSYLTANFAYTYDTNCFSSPLPQYNITLNWLKWKNINPLIEKHNLGINLDFAFFPKENSRVGLSTNIYVSFPIRSTAIRPIPDDEIKGFKGNWEYYYENNLETQKPSCFMAIGPIFKITLHDTTLGLSLRLSIGGFDYIDNEVILGFQFTPFLNYLITDRIYLQASLLMDSHTLKFTSQTENIFEPYYQLFTVSPALGIGIKF